MPLLDGRTAVVTGGAQGIGFAIAERYVAEGARVVLGDLDLAATEAAVEKLGGREVAAAVRCDVTDAAEVEAMIAAAVDTFGGLDVMVNNAGITRDATMRKMTEEQFDQVISVHLKGTWNGTRLGGRRHAREQERRDHQHLVDLGQGGPDRPDELLRGQGGHRRHDEGRGQGGRAPRRADQRDSTRPDPLGDDRGHAATDLGRQTRRDTDGAGRRARARSPRSHSSSPPTCRRT